MESVKVEENDELGHGEMVKVEKEVIIRNVRKMGRNEVNVERVAENPREEVVREKRADAVEDGGPEVRVVVERLDVWEMVKR